MTQDKQHKNKVSLLDLANRMSYQYPYKKEQIYVFNGYSGMLENAMEICDNLGISFEEFYPFDYGYIPLDPFCTDAPLREYLTSLHQKETDSFLNEHSGENGIEGAFCTKFEFSIFLSGWGMYLDELRIRKALDWCKQYGIQYTTDIPIFDGYGTIKEWIKLNRATQANVNRIIKQFQSESNQSYQSGDGSKPLKKSRKKDLNTKG